ncbi:hypothetical protein YC2023_016132 [Brassica napus]
MNPRKFPRNFSSEYTEGLLPRNIPRDSFLGIFRGLRSSEISDENSEEHFVGTSEDWTIGKSIGIYRGNIPRKFSLVPENENSSADCIAEVKSEVGRLWSLTERLLENAGIADGAASTCINGL